MVSFEEAIAMSALILLLTTAIICFASWKYIDRKIEREYEAMMEEYEQYNSWEKSRGDP